MFSFSGKESLDVYTTSFRLDAWTPFAERAVTSILSGTKSVLSDKCNGITTVICDQYRNSPQEVGARMSLCDRNVDIICSCFFFFKSMLNAGNYLNNYDIYYTLI